MDGLWIAPVLAQAADKAPTTATLPWQFFVILAVVFILPFVLGTLIAQALRLKDLGGQIGVVLFSIALGLSPFAYRMLHGQPWTDAISLGIDLAGGTNLIYAVDLVKAKADEKPVDNATLDKLVQAIGRRINPGGAEEVTVRRVGSDRIEVIIPGADREKVEQTKRRIVDLGSLEFAILANEKDHRRQIEAARKFRPDQDNLIEGGRVAASWRSVAMTKEGKMKDVVPFGDDRVAIREVERTIEGQTVKVRQFLVVHEPADKAVTGKYLTRVAESMDESGQPAVSFNFSARGGVLFSTLTGRYQPDKTEGFRRRLAVLLNGEIHTAPNLIARISTSGQITGQFKKQEIADLITTLNAGALEVPLIREPVSEFTISPLLGIDVQTKGVTAILVSAAVVFLFMLVFYLVAGVVADLCLVLNLILVVGSMAFIDATFTLPGLAGLVLTIGMAVDSNVLIYERMREELARGASLRMAIENGFDKAFSAIIDGNVTTLLTAVILYLIGSDQIRGFAVSLFIGLTMSLFSTLYFGHLCFKIMERKRWVSGLKMMRLMGETKLDFLKTRGIAFAGSAALILAGMGALVARGTTNLDIDFTGGTLVTFEFVEPQQTENVKAKLVEKMGSTISLERLVLVGEQTTAEGGKRFRMRTTEKVQAAVTKSLTESFSDPSMALVRVTMETGPVEAIPAENLKEGETASDRFAGGSQGSVKFSSGLGPATIAAYVTDELRKIPGDKEGSSKYDAASSLIEIVGTKAAEKSKNDTTLGEKFLEANVRAVPQVDAADLTTALKGLSAYLAANPAFEEVNSFDTSVAQETQVDALLAILASLVMIVIYIWVRFEKVYFGLAAVVALAHDVLVTLGCVCLAAYLSGNPIGSILMFDDFKVNLALIASLLTIVGYSLNDTIVIFDRLREIKGKNPKITYDMINLSVNQTLSRTILTALTVFLVVFVLYVFGGDGIHGFAFSMLIGTITGAYSTVYIANPVLLWLVQREDRLASPGGGKAKSSPTGASV